MIQIEAIDIEYGNVPQKNNFNVHKSVLTPGSGLAESIDPSHPHKLDFCRLRGFGLYRTWLYTRVTRMEDNENELGRVDHVEFVEAFDVGEAAEDMDFQIAIIDEILRLAQDDELDEEFSNYGFARAAYRP